MRANPALAPPSSLALPGHPPCQRFPSRRLPSPPLVTRRSLPREGRLSPDGRTSPLQPRQLPAEMLIDLQLRPRERSPARSIVESTSRSLPHPAASRYDSRDRDIVRSATHPVAF